MSSGSSPGKRHPRVTLAMLATVFVLLSMWFAGSADAQEGPVSPPPPVEASMGGDLGVPPPSLGPEPATASDPVPTPGTHQPIPVAPQLLPAIPDPEVSATPAPQPEVAVAPDVADGAGGLVRDVPSESRSLVERSRSEVEEVDVVVPVPPANETVKDAVGLVVEQVAPVIVLGTEPVQPIIDVRSIVEPAERRVTSSPASAHPQDAAAAGRRIGAEMESASRTSKPNSDLPSTPILPLGSTLAIVPATSAATTSAQVAAASAARPEVPRIMIAAAVPLVGGSSAPGVPWSPQRTRAPPVGHVPASDLDRYGQRLVAVVGDRGGNHAEVATPGFPVRPSALLQRADSVPTSPG